MKQTILIIGGGGREHTIGWKLLQSRNVGKIFFAPGNGGTRNIGTNVSVDPNDAEALLTFAKRHAVDLTIVGPETALSAGVVDRFEQEGLRIFGPTQEASRLETSKVWALQFMKRHGLPCPTFKIFDQVDDARTYVKKPLGICVIKADGLCQGKGVFVCEGFKEANDAIELLMVKKIFGDAGKQIVIQEKLTGKEVSMMAFCDGKLAVPLIAAQDYKRAFEGDRGPNTGGMGSQAPATRVHPSLFTKIEQLLTKTVDAMYRDGIPYHGLLYAGIMVVGSNPYILEYNCRFGDPETQVQLPLLVSDLLTVINACADGTLSSSMVRWSKNSAVCVVLASSGYPGAYKTGKFIHGLSAIPKNTHSLIFHAGTSSDGNLTKTRGGRVLNIVSVARSKELARKKVYSMIGKPVSFEGMTYRKDIAE